MATTLWLHDENAAVSRGADTAPKAGGTAAWKARVLKTAVETTANVTIATNTVAGATSGIEVQSGGLYQEWISAPLAAAATISGTVSFDICSHESNMSANATVAVIIERLDKELGIASTIVDSSFGTELGTSNARRSWTASPTSTNMGKGERVRVRVYFDDATATTMASGYTCTLTYDGTVANTGDSKISFNEDLTFMGSLPNGASFTLQTGPDATSDFNDLCYGASDDLFVAVGVGGKIWTSSNGSSWTNQTTPSADGMMGVCYGGSDDLFVAVGALGKIWTSPQGTAWTSRTTPNTTQMNSVAYSSALDLFCAVGDTGAVWKSSNGVDWSVATSTPNTTATLRNVCWDATNSLFLASGNDGTTCVWSSPDGDVWTQRTSGVNAYAIGTASGTSLTAIAGSAGSGVFETSTNGTTWSSALPVGATDYGNFRGAYAIAADANGYILAMGMRTQSLTFMLTVLHAASQRFAAYDTGIPYAAGSANIGLAVRPSDGLVVAISYNGVILTSANPNWAASTAFLTDTASDIADQGTVEKKAWTTRGTG